MDPIRILAGLRLAVGVSVWATPGLAARTFGLDLGRNPQAPYFARLFGARDVAMAVGTMQATGAAQRQWLTLGVAVDAVDAVAALLGGRSGAHGRATTVLAGGVAVGAAGLGVLALQGAGAQPGAPSSSA